MRMTRRAASGLLLAAAAAPAFGQTAEPIPGTAQIFSELDKLLNVYDAAVGPAGTNRPAYGTELSTANGHYGPALLTPQQWELNTLMLDRFRALGIEVVKISVTYPLLDDSLPDNARYLDFYTRTAAACRDRGIKIQVSLQFTFPQGVFNPLHVSYANTTFEGLKAAQANALAKIIPAMKPDWVSLFNEPTTQSSNTGHPELRDPKLLARYITDLVEGAPKSPTKIGAGNGNWESAELTAALLSTPIDFFDLHIYSIGQGFAVRPRQLIEAAQAAGKRVFIGEAWLMKRIEGPNVKVDQTPVFGRDALAAASPLDQRFIATTARLATLPGVDGLTFFWSRYFFKYLGPSDIRIGETAADIFQAGSTESFAAMRSGKFSSTGDFYRDLIAKARA